MWSCGLRSPFVDNKETAVSVDLSWYVTNLWSGVAVFPAVARINRLCSTTWLRAVADYRLASGYIALFFKTVWYIAWVLLWFIDVSLSHLSRHGPVLPVSSTHYLYVFGHCFLPPYHSFSPTCFSSDYQSHSVFHVCWLTAQVLQTSNNCFCFFGS